MAPWIVTILYFPTVVTRNSLALWGGGGVVEAEEWLGASAAAFGCVPQASLFFLGEMGGLGRGQPMRNTVW